MNKQIFGNENNWSKSEMIEVFSIVIALIAIVVPSVLFFIQQKSNNEDFKTQIQLYKAEMHQNQIKK